MSFSSVWLYVCTRLRTRVYVYRMCTDSVSFPTAGNEIWEACGVHPMHRHKTLNGRTPERKTSDTGELGEHEKPLTTDTSAYKLSCLMSHFRERLYLPRGNSFTIYNSNLKCYMCGVKLISRMCSDVQWKTKVLLHTLLQTHGFILFCCFVGATSGD